MDINTLSKKIQDLEERVRRLETVSSQPPAGPTPLDKRISAKEFMLSGDIASATEKTLALAYYLEYIAGVSPFNVSDLANTFRAAREKVPANLNDMINRNIGRALLMEAGERKDAKKAWVLTATGEKYMAEKLNINRA